MFQALSDRDSVSMRSYCFADISFYEYGQLWNMDTLIRKSITLNQSAGFKRVNYFDFIHIETGESLAWLTYRLISVITKGSGTTTAEWLKTAVLGIQEKQWKVKHLHSTLIKRTLN